MPRHVRFSKKNTFHSPAPPASPSSASSFGPPTPPPLPHFTWSAGTKSSGPRGLYGTPNRRAHNLLALSPAPSLRFDVSLNPSTITTYLPTLSPAAFTEPAVHPPQAAITLETPHLPWAIRVPASNATFVTVADVVSTIYRTLRESATPAEFEALRTNKLMGQVSAAYTRRCERLRGHRAYEPERRGGIKRVDFLMGYHKFRGIAPKEGVSDVWQLSIS
ncbi:hypothetical protein C8R45DRAFT_248235 [Mycena sanguinolenta]|nr:hypothetical protein C8R45DRAFT_248235 [Mycena sanguinolenta]